MILIDIYTYILIYNNKIEFEKIYHCWIGVNTLYNLLFMYTYIYKRFGSLSLENFEIPRNSEKF